MKKDLKVPIAYIDLISKQIIEPQKSTEKTDYFCPGCSNIVRLRESILHNLHFYHLVDSNCSYESILHKLYKKVIYESKKFMAPDGTLIIFDRVELEKNIFNYRPDVIGYIENEAYLIEVIKTNGVSETKLNKIKQSNMPCFSINCVYDKYNDIVNHVVESKYHKEFIYTSQIEELDIEIEQYKTEKEYYENVKVPAIENINELLNQKFKQIVQNNFAMNFKTVCSNGSHLYTNPYFYDFVIFFNPEKKIMTLKFNK